MGNSFVKTLVKRRLGAAALRLMFACCAISATAKAQYRFDTWNTDNGLPNNSVFAVLQTRDG